VVAVVATLVAAALLHRYPGPNTVDRAGAALVPVAIHSRFLKAISWLGTLPALLIGSIGAALLAWHTGGRDHRRAIACLFGPSIAVALNEWAIKPLVGRYYQGELSFASGSVVVVAGVATAWILAARSSARPGVAAVGMVVVLLMVVAVVALQWHYPSDALAGVTLGVGVVLLADAALVGTRENSYP
jgi:undecaprenyl-diphosphatase